MKTIGVITYHRAYNYGASLQAYATVQLLREFGFEPSIIDYCPSNLRDYDSFKTQYNDVSNSSSFLPIRIVKAIVKTIGASKRAKTFNNFANDEMPLTRPYMSNDELKSDVPHVDVMCSGSDQVWNNYYTRQFDPAFFLDFAPEGIPRISISSSFGKDSFSEEEIDSLKNLLKDYNYISVRENAGCAVLDKVGIQKYDLMPDPTILLEKETWQSFADKGNADLRCPYVLVYQLHGDSSTSRHAIAYARKNGMEAVSIVTMPYQAKRGCRNIVAPDVYDFVRLFKEAACVFTDSFHGTVFSLLFEKKLAMTLPVRFSDRVKTLLGEIDAEGLVFSDEVSWEASCKQVDRKAVSAKLDELRNSKRIVLESRLSAFR